jgi:hypothetical protein
LLRIGSLPFHRASAKQALFVIGNAGQPVLISAVGARARLIAGEEIPGAAPFAIVFAHGSPLS